MRDIKALEQAIETMHGCKCCHIGSKAVKEAFEEQVAWEGQVEIFNLEGHRTAKICYAWSYEDDGGETQYVTVLEIPPVDSPETAVKVAIAKET